MSAPDQLESLLPLLLQYVHVGVVVHAPDTRIVLANEQACHFLGLSLEQMLGKAAIDPDWCFVSEDETRLPLAAYPVNQVLATRQPLRDQVVGVRRPALRDTVWGLANAFPEFAAEGDLTRVVVTFIDITARKRAELEVEDSRWFLDNLIEQSPTPMWVSDEHGTLIRINRACCAMLRLTPDEVIGIYNVFEDTIVERQGLIPLIRSVYREGKVVTFDLVYDTTQLANLQLKRSAQVILNVTISPIRNSNGTITNAVIQHINITERRYAEEALRESEERFRTLVDSAPDGIFVQSGGHCLFVNPAMVALLGAARSEDLLGSETQRWIAPEYHQAVQERIVSLQRTGQPAVPDEQVYLRMDGSRVAVETTAVAMKFQGQDAYLVFVRDMTTRKQADAERETLQAQLQHAQKMESVGRLAGGIAHDFNNILMVQRGYCELLRSRLHAEDPIAEGLARIDACAEKAAALTRQLLTFSRKQPLQPSIFDLRVLVTNLSDMLRRLMGEDVTLMMTVPANPAFIQADPGQIEQVLVNLVVNARDAMPQGGTLRIEVMPVLIDETYAECHLDVVPGPYVMLAVSDTGCGMDQATLGRIFEPFFTTKGEGQGTGLGLSTVYGIVHQSGGRIWVYSEVGSGTTFKIYLPHHEEQPARPDAAEPALIRGDSELILVVEDEPSLRDLLKLLIVNLGYRAYVASNGGAALILIEEEGIRPDLLITDVVMPSMSGRLLVERLHKTVPDLPVIYMSGYTNDTIVQHKILEQEIHYLQKPFSRADLALAIKAALVG